MTAAITSIDHLTIPFDAKPSESTGTIRGLKVSNWSKVKDWVIAHKKELLIALLVASIASVLTGLGLILVPAILFTATAASAWSGFALSCTAAYPLSYSAVSLNTASCEEKQKENIYQKGHYKELA